MVLEKAFSHFGIFLLQLITHWGNYLIFVGQAFQKIFYPFVKIRLVIQQMEFVGVRSFWIIVMAAIMVGAVFGLQFGQIFRIFGVESLIGTAAAFALSKELSPVLSAFLVTGRAGSSMAAEIANMKINEQIDAMRVMAVNPVAFLASPRVLASIVMVPLLSAFFTIVGVLSAFVIGTILYEVDRGIFLDKISWINKPWDIIDGLIKAAIFGAIFSTVCCYKGFRAEGGARGVGKATTDAVVISLVVVLVSDFFLSYFQMRSLFS